MDPTAQDLAIFISHILGNDNELRKQNEKLLTELVKSQPDSFIQHILSLLSSHPAPSIRGFCAVSLRNHLSLFSGLNYQHLWDQLTPALHPIIQNTLFSLLSKEQDPSIRNKISDAIGEIAGGLLESRENPWPNIVPQVLNLLFNENSLNVESGLKVLSSLFLYTEKVFLPYKGQLFEVFKASLVNEAIPSIQAGAIEALGCFLSRVSSKQAKGFDELANDVLKATVNLVINQNTLGENALKSLESIAETEPKFFRKSFPQVFEAMKLIFFDPKVNELGHKKIATEVLLALAERTPQVFRDSPNYIEQLLQILFCHMVEIEEGVEPSWENPPEGFSAELENEADYEAVFFGTTSIDKLIGSIGEKQVLPILSVLVQVMMEKDDWRCKHAGIMALSQVGEYLEQNLEEICPIINLVLSYLNSPNAKLRYSCFHCLGQISNDMKPILQSELHEQVLPALISGLKDPIPRVQAHAAASVTNFVEGMASLALRPYLTSLLTQFFNMIRDGSSLVKENAVSALAATAEASQEDFQGYFKQFVELLFETINSHRSNEYRQLLGIIIECLTLIVHAIGKESSNQFLGFLLEEMLLLQDSIAEKKDPLKIYLLWGWQRLCLVLKQDIASFLPRFLPGLIKILTWELDISKPINEDPQEEEHPDLEASLKLIGTLVQDLGKYLGTHLLPIIQLLVSTVSNNALEEVLRGSAAEILPKILLLLQESSPKDAGEYGHYFIEIILNLLANELDAGFLKGLVLALKDSLGILGCYMQELELAEFCKKVIKVIYDSDQRKDREKEVPGVDDLDNEDLELMKEKIGLEEDLQVAVAQLIGILFKTYGAASLKLAEFLQVEVLPRVCHPGLSDKIHRLCLVLVDDMMQYLGRELLKDKWLIFPQYLFPFLLDPCCGVREAAFYGLGLFIAQAKEELQELADVFLEKFLLALDLKAQTGEKQRAFLHCQDNITAALGKMAFYHWEKGCGRKAFSIWVFHLPIRYEKFECYFQHEVLGTLALKAGVGGLKELGVLEQVVKVLAEVMDTRLVNQQGQEIVQECFIRWIKEGNDEDFQGTIERLGMLDKKKIENCLARQG